MTVCDFLFDSAYMVCALTKFKMLYMHTDGAARNYIHCVHIFPVIFKNNDASQRVNELLYSSWLIPCSVSKHGEDISHRIHMYHKHINQIYHTIKCPLAIFLPVPAFSIAMSFLYMSYSPQLLEEDEKLCLTYPHARGFSTKQCT